MPRPEGRRREALRPPVLVASLFLAIAALASAAPIEVRVRGTPAGPRLFVNGQVRAPRFVYVSPGNRSVELSTTWQAYDLAFSSTSRTQEGRVQFRFEKNDVAVDVRNVVVTDEAGRAVALQGSFGSDAAFRALWGVQLEGTGGTLAFDGGAARVSVRKPKIWYDDFHLYSKTFRLDPNRRYRLRFEARADRVAQLMPTAFLVEPGKAYVFAPFDGYDVMSEQVRLAADAGVDFVTFPAPCSWTETGNDWSDLEALMRRILAANPRAILLPRVGIDAPAWYLKRHPEIRVKFSDGFEPMTGGIADPAYRAAACDHAEKTARHLRETFPGHFAGLHLGALATGEWIYPKRNALYYGYDRPTRDAFRRWLAKRGDAAAATAEVPTAAERRLAAEPDYSLRDPAKGTKVAAFMQFLQDDLVDFIGELGAAVRRGTDGHSLAVFFYGYSWELADRENGPSETGHYGLGRLLHEHRDNVDILCAPYSYFNRRWPGSSATMSPAESIMRAGVLWLTENDTRTCLERTWDAMTLNVSGGHRITKPETRQVLSRITAFDMIHGYGSWWMDLLGRGWYCDRDLWTELTRLAPLEEKMLARKGPYAPDLVAVVEEKGMHALAPGSNVVMPPLTSRYPFDQCGVPYAQALLEDVLSGCVRAKMQVYSLVFALSARERAALKRLRREQPEAMRVWCWAPGWISDAGAADANVEDATTFRVRRADPPLRATVTSTPEGLAAGLRPTWGCGMPGKIRPCFGVETRPGDEVWARYEHDGSAAMVVRKNAAGGHDVFLGTAHFLPEALSALARRAGVHVYAKPAQCNVCAAEDVVAVQALVDGPIDIDFGTAAPVRDLLTGETLGPGPVIAVPFRKGDLRVFTASPDCY